MRIKPKKHHLLVLFCVAEEDRGRVISPAPPSLFLTLDRKSYCNSRFGACYSFACWYKLTGYCTAYSGGSFCHTNILSIYYALNNWARPCVLALTTWRRERVSNPRESSLVLRIKHSLQTTPNRSLACPLQPLGYLSIFWVTKNPIRWPRGRDKCFCYAWRARAMPCAYT